MLILPQEGRLDIQTESGRMMVRPGELAVIQAGMKFAVNLPDGTGRGYIQEIFGSYYELPELGPIGPNGMAMPRDFEIPLASFDVDQSPWTIVVKLVGQLFAYEQGHTPFDVIAWHGNYAPYKYALEKFINAATVDRNQSDPSIYCVLTGQVQDPWHLDGRLLRLHAQVERDTQHVPPTVLPPQRGDRAHGYDPRRWV